MKTLVTGATGFIGNHLVKSLLEKGRDIRCLVRKTSNKSSLENLGVELAYGDLLDKDSLKKAVKNINIIYHLGGEVYSSRVVDYYKTNIQGTKNILEASLSSPIEKFIYFSSIAAAGPNYDKNKLINEDDPCKPVTSYGMSKLEAEKAVKNFYEKYNLPVMIVRLPVVYGPGQSKDVTKIFKMVIKGQFIFFGNGENIKSLCHIENLIYGSTLVEEYKDSKFEVFYIADGDPYTISYIVKTIAAKAGMELSCFYFPSFLADIPWLFYITFIKFGISSMLLYIPKSLSLNFGCDISKARKKLFYTPMVRFEKGIEDTLNWLLSNTNLNKL